MSIITNIDSRRIELLKAFKLTLLEYVNRKSLEREDLQDLIGNLNNVQLMLDFHRDHISLVIMLISIREEDLCLRNLPWIYHTYHNQGFSYKFFEMDFKLWIDSVEYVTGYNEIKSILHIHERMLLDHERSIIKSEEYKPHWDHRSLTDTQISFLESLLKGDQKSFNDLSNSYIKSKNDLESYYADIVTPVMYAVGGLWELGEISVAEEHLASAIVSRVLATHYQYMEYSFERKGKVVICSSANEYHEIGAWITANMFEAEGWDVHYLGANVTISDLESIIKKIEPKILGLSVSMAYNYEIAEEIIERIRSNTVLKDLKIILGGSLFSIYPELCRYSKADYVAKTFKESLHYSNKLLTDD
jgi:methanogenic corrinoid protein MtbC1